MKTDPTYGSIRRGAPTVASSAAMLFGNLALGMTCDQAVIKRRASGDFTSLGQLLSFEHWTGADKVFYFVSRGMLIGSFLISRFGWSRFREALGRVSTGNMSTFEELYGASAKEIELGWIASLGTP